MPNEQLQLPYELIDKVAGRNPGRVTYKIPFLRLQEREGFNKRTVYDDIATLRVWFKNGKVYDYDKVPMNVFEALKKVAMTGGSVGAHFAENIKGKYSFIETT